MIGRLNHVAIAVPDLSAATELYKGTLGASVSEPLDLPDHGVTTVFVTLPNTKLELLHPLGTGSPIAGFLAKNPSGGIHHLCYWWQRVRACWGTGSPAPVLTTSPCCSCIPKISVERLSSSSRSKEDSWIYSASSWSS
jgi:methylmalonyl-CoA/ethylmalonyl-CoA epimerase